jgi:hypothetical protein
VEIGVLLVGRRNIDKVGMTMTCCDGRKVPGATYSAENDRTREIVRKG